LISWEIVEQIFQPVIVLTGLIRLFEFTVGHFVSFVSCQLAASPTGGLFFKPCTEIVRGVTRSPLRRAADRVLFLLRRLVGRNPRRYQLMWT
jgi:hypothetical protein